MSFYGDRILPVRLTMRNERLALYRQRVIAGATGRVLEIGIGAGENLSRYGTDVSEVIGLEPSPKLAAMARDAARHTRAP
jgi:SAM-dependent methyltransferase